VSRKFCGETLVAREAGRGPAADEGVRPTLARQAQSHGVSRITACNSASLSGRTASGRYMAIRWVRLPTIETYGYNLDRYQT